MNKLTQIFTLFIIFGASNSAMGIYRCDTPNGVLFSQQKCGKGAVLIESKRSVSQKPKVSPIAKSSQGGHVAGLDSASVQELLDTVGQPSAKYIYKGIEHWFYTDIEQNVNGKVRSPEILLQNGYSYQVSWLSNEEIEERASLAKKISAWSPSNTKQRINSVEDFDVKGLSRREVLEKLGEPVAKTIADGAERWEYVGVPAGVSTNTYVTVFVDFDGDLVAGL